MSRQRPITFKEVLQASGIDPRVLHFAQWNGMCLGSSDLIFDEQAARLRRLHPEMDRADVVLLLGENLSAEVAEFFDTAFPVIGGAKK